MNPIDRVEMSSSICCDPGNAPIRFHWYQIPEEPTLMARFESLFDGYSVPDGELARFKGEFRERVLRAMAGRLAPITEVRDIQRHPKVGLYEIKWRFDIGDEDEVLVRMYHVEPVEIPACVVSVHIHRKELGRDSRETNRLQNSEIDFAETRYWTGRPARWGHT